MEHILSEAVTQWGSFGILVGFAIYIIYIQLKDLLSKKKESKNTNNPQTNNQMNNEYLITTIITSLTNKIDNVVNRIDNMEHNFSQRINSIESQLHGQPNNIISMLEDINNKKKIAHNKMMEDQMKLGPELHKILFNYSELLDCDHIFLGSFPNGNTNISGIPYCKFDIIAEKFSPNTVERDIEYAFMYKDAEHIMGLANTLSGFYNDNILDRNFVFSSASLHQFLLALLAFLFYGLFQVLDVHIPKKLLA